MMMTTMECNGHVVTGVLEGVPLIIIAGFVSRQHCLLFGHRASGGGGLGSNTGVVISDGVRAGRSFEFR